MRNRLIALAVVALAMLAASQTQAAQRVSGSRYGEWVKVNHNGVVSYRYTYPGKANGFPPPAMYYYGYPQSGYSYGIGF